MLNVFITVDTEVWPQGSEWRCQGLRSDLKRDIYGETPEGGFGVPYQMDVLDRHGLKGIFLVESLFACAVGLDPLREIVDLIQGRGHEVQLHLHTEWLAWMDPSILPGRTGQNLKDFSLEEQTFLLGRGLENLRACGAKKVCAFRAGNYGANWDTLTALKRNGIRFDTSHNTCYLGRECDMPGQELLLGPREMDGVWEIPVAFFRDWPGHFRHAQLVACSARELENALLDAWQKDWNAFVIVSHSFELLKRKGPVRPDWIVVRRFERLCRFLSEHRDKFRSTGFSDLDPESMPHQPCERPLQSGGRFAAWRFLEQLARRVM